MCIYGIQTNFPYAIQTKLFFSIPNVDIIFLSVPQVEKLSICHIDKKTFFHMRNTLFVYMICRQIFHMQYRRKKLPMTNIEKKLYIPHVEKYVLSRVDGPSSRQTGDEGVGEKNVCPGIKRRQKAITFPVCVQFLKLCDKTPVLLRQIRFLVSDLSK